MKTVYFLIKKTKFSAIEKHLKISVGLWMHGWKILYTARKKKIIIKILKILKFQISSWSINKICKICKICFNNKYVLFFSSSYYY